MTPTATAAVIYTRSSKDGADVAPAAQRTELKDYAKKKGYRVVADYSDAAVSANADPPQLAAMLRELDDPKRAWTVILAVDSSRIARDADLAGVINFQARKAGVRFEFSKMPGSGNAAMDLIVGAVARAWDQYHSMISKQKGIAGMRTNVELGHRAGGRAPLGYMLKHVTTGAMRGGEPVQKSHLVLDPEWAPRVKKYLHLRVQGMPRVLAAQKASLTKKPVTTLISVERNALTYAGANVWNRHADPKANPSGDRFRPRDEWVITPDTYPALITMAQAEALLARAMPTGRRNRRGPSGKFLLSGLLFTPEGVPMVSSGDGSYRVAPKGRRVTAALLETAVLRELNEIMQGDVLIDQFVSELKRAAAELATDPTVLKKELKGIEAKIANLLNLASATKSLSLAARLEELEAARADAAARIAHASERAAEAKALAAITPEQAGKMLKSAWKPQGSVAEQAAALAQIVERIEFDPAAGTGRVLYRLRQVEAGAFSCTGVKVASPRGFEPRLSP